MMMGRCHDMPIRAQSRSQKYPDSSRAKSPSSNVAAQSGVPTPSLAAPRLWMILLRSQCQETSENRSTSVLSAKWMTEKWRQIFPQSRHEARGGSMPGAGESFAAAHRWVCCGANLRSGTWRSASAGAVRPRSKAVPSTALQVLRPARGAVMECCARRRCGFDPRLTIPPAAARRPLRPPIPDSRPGPQSKGGSASGTNEQGRSWGKRSACLCRGLA